MRLIKVRARSRPDHYRTSLARSATIQSLVCACDPPSALLRWTKPLPSADRAFKSDQHTFDAARPDAALDFNGCDRLELPALGSMLIEHILKLFAGHLPAEHALAELDHRVLVSIRHATTILSHVLSGHASRATTASSCLTALSGHASRATTASSCLTAIGGPGRATFYESQA